MSNCTFIDVFDSLDETEKNYIYGLIGRLEEDKAKEILSKNGAISLNFLIKKYFEDVFEVEK